MHPAARSDTRRARSILAFQDGVKLEQIPVVLGVLVALAGIFLAYDSFRPETFRPFKERRRRMRTPVNRTGQLLVAGGLLCMGGALAGRDTWRWGTVSVIVGAILLLSGGLMNRAYLREMLLFRGAARRADAGEGAAKSTDSGSGKKMRIR